MADKQKRIKFLENSEYFYQENEWHAVIYTDDTRTCCGLAYLDDEVYIDRQDNYLERKQNLSQDQLTEDLLDDNYADHLNVTFIEKYVTRGGITCKDCINNIKKFKKIKL